MTRSSPPTSQSQRIVRAIVLILLVVGAGLFLVIRQKSSGTNLANDHVMHLKNAHGISSSSSGGGGGVLDDIPDCNNNGDDETCRIPKSLPVGAIYKTHFDFPMLGHYNVVMRIKSESTAQLVVEGGFPIQDELEYKLIVQSDVTDPASKVLFSVELSDHLHDILERFWVTLSEIQYDPIADSPSVTVEIAHVVTFSLKLER